MTSNDKSGLTSEISFKHLLCFMAILLGTPLTIAFLCTGGMLSALTCFGMVLFALALFKGKA